MKEKMYRVIWDDGHAEDMTEGEFRFMHREYGQDMVHIEVWYAKDGKI